MLSTLAHFPSKALVVHTTKSQLTRDNVCSTVASIFVRIAPGMYALSALTGYKDPDTQDKGRSRKRAQREAKDDQTHEVRKP